jgi:hypothetical protein
MQLFVIYEHPPTHPDSYVLREFELHADGQVSKMGFAVRETLAEVRRVVPPAMFCVPRRTGEPSVVEVWL